MKPPKRSHDKKACQNFGGNAFENAVDTDEEMDEHPELIPPRSVPKVACRPMICNSHGNNTKKLKYNTKGKTRRNSNHLNIVTPKV